MRLGNQDTYFQVQTLSLFWQITHFFMLQSVHPLEGDTNTELLCINALKTGHEGKHLN